MKRAHVCAGDPAQGVCGVGSWGAGAPKAEGESERGVEGMER